MDFRNDAPPSYDQLTNDRNCGEKNQQKAGKSANSGKNQQIKLVAEGNLKKPGVKPVSVCTGQVS